MNKNFIDFINEKYNVINKKQESFKKRMILENKNNLTSLSIDDIEKYNNKRSKGIKNDLINCVGKIKDGKKYFFLTITLKGFENKLLSNEKILDGIKQQDKLLKRFVYLIFKKRIDKQKISLGDLETIIKYELTKKGVMHVHVLCFYEREETLITICKRIKNYKKHEEFSNIGRVENVVSSRSYSYIADFFNLKKILLDKTESLIDGNFRTGDFTYFKKLNKDGDLIKYVYKYLTKRENTENKIFKILKIRKQIYSNNFFNGVSKYDLENLNYYFFKIMNNLPKIKSKYKVAKGREKEELKFKINLIEIYDNVSMNIISAIQKRKIIIVKNKKSRNYRYEREKRIGFNKEIYRIPIFDVLTKKTYQRNYLKYKYDANREKYINNKEYYDNKNIFSLTYKHNFLKDYAHENFKRGYLDYENTKKIYMMNADKEKNKFKNFGIKRLEEITKMENENLTEMEKHIKKYGDTNSINFYYKQDIQYLKSQFNDKIKNLFYYEFEEIKNMFDEYGEVKLHYNDTEHFTENFKYEF